MYILVCDGLVVSDKIILDGAVAIGDNKIAAVGFSSEMKRRFPRYERLDAKGCAIIPGLINTHTHAAMTLLRGYAEEISLFQWLNEKIWPVEAHLTPRDIQIGAELAAYESILFGCSTLNSMYFYSDKGSELAAFEKIGIRSTVGHGFVEKNVAQGLEITKEMAKKWHGKDDGRLRISVCPHAPYSTGPESYRLSSRMVEELNNKYGDKGKVILHTHVAESSEECSKTNKAFKVDTKEGIVTYLSNIGILSSNMVIAHAIHLTEKDMFLLKKHDVKISLNPISNLKLGMGVAKCSQLLERGLIVSLGTDGPASNNTLDIFETMKTISLLMKGLGGDPRILPAKQVFKMATEYGAIALGYEDLGAIRPGYLADIVILNLKVPHATPFYDIYNHLIYSARSSDVKTVIVNGKLILEDRMFPKVRLNKFLERVEKTKSTLFSRIGIHC